MLLTPAEVRFEGVDCTPETQSRDCGAVDALAASMPSVGKDRLLGTLLPSANSGLKITLVPMPLYLRGPLVGVCSTVGIYRFLCVGLLSGTTSAIGLMTETGTCAQPEDGISFGLASGTVVFCSCKVLLAKTFFRRLAAGVDII